jgi:nucleotide-binding universal stress UspA family protein
MVGRIPEVVATYAAEHGHHLIVIDHRRSFVGDHLFRSNADRIVERAPCPVMLVR